MDAILPSVSSLRSTLSGGALAGVVSAAINLAYFALHRVFTGAYYVQTGALSIAASSFLPSVLSALGYWILRHHSAHAQTIFWAVTACITLLSFQGVFAATLPDGSPKPAGFDGLVMPMHVVVGLVAALLVPWFAERGEWANR